MSEPQQAPAAAFPQVQQVHPRGTMIPHVLPHGTCVTFVPNPPAWAYRPDGTLKHPSEIHRPKAGDEQILYLNFEGPTITPGSDNPEQNQSNIPYSTSVIPAFDHVPFQRGNLDTRAKVIDAIRNWAMYFYSHTNLLVVTERPPAGVAYSMVVVGGDSSAIGQPSGVLGIAPFDCYQDERNVCFVFSEDHGSDLEELVLTIVHEAGHTFGLAHIDDQSAIMYPVNPMGEAYWGNSGTVQGAACDGTWEQDSLAVLQQMLGDRLDTTPPWVEITTPGQSAIVASSFESLVHGFDNVALYSVEYFVDGASIRKETLPDFSFNVGALPDGAHQLWAIGEDAHGNSAQSEIVDVTVEANCSALATCNDGLAAVGELCFNGADCMSGLCAATLSNIVGTGVCSLDCTEDLLCPLGTECITTDASPVPGQPEPVEHYCAIGLAPVSVMVDSSGAGFELSGCSAAGRAVPAVPFGLLLLLGLLGLLALRRRS
ncbi:MAG: matrixin family metalloprotease [bacterium]